MTSRDFCFWLQGFFELSGLNTPSKGLTYEQVEMIERHLNLVFKQEIDPSMGDEKHQQQLNEAHTVLPFVGKPARPRC